MVDGALEGLRVLDLSTGIAGPMAAMYLADFGADVVKGEPPGGDPGRKLAGFAVWNRNKRGILLEPESPRFDEFAAGADVCVLSDASPAVEPKSLAAKYPRLVILHMPPYVSGETPWCGGESHGLLTAFGGTARRQSSFDGGPIDLVYPTVLYVQAQWGAAAAVAALIERERSGLGQVVGVGGIHGVMVSCCGQMVVVPGQDALPTNVGPGGRHPCYTTYQAGDGQWLFLAALTPKFQVNAFKVLGVGNIFADPRIQGVPMRMLLPENRGWVRQLLSDAFCSKPRDEWLELLEIGDCPAGPVCERDAWLDHPQILANDLRVDVHDPERGQVTMPGQPLVLTGSPSLTRSPAPTLGQHDAAVTPWPAQPPVSRDSADSDRGPLAGFRILDLGTILAGPYAGTLLAELGADVIKVEPPTGDAFRETGFIYNRGQRGLAIDLASAAGREAFYALVRTSDVVLDNSRMGVRERLHIDYASLAEVKPDIVTLSVTGFGERGPLAHKPGFDPVLQAMSGMMAAQGGDSEPVLFTIPVNDIAAGTLAVLGICLGLFHRLRTGQGQRTWTSLLGCSAMMQSGELVRFEGRPPAIRGCRDHAGPSPLDRFYATSDGWIRIQAASGESLPRIDFAATTTAAALEALTAAGVPCAVARQPAELTVDPCLKALDVFTTLHMQDGTPFVVTNRYAQFSRTQEHAIFEAPGLGEHSRALLSEAGVPDVDIDALIATGAVKQGPPFRVAAIQNYR